MLKYVSLTNIFLLNENDMCSKKIQERAFSQLSATFHVLRLSKHYTKHVIVKL